MENCLILYYTGTYNTLYLVNEFSKKTSLFFNIISKDITQETEVNIDDFSLIFLFYPIYAFNAPALFEKQIKKMHIKNKKIVIIKNSGEPLILNNSSSNYIKKILTRNNCELIGEYHLIMPYYILFRHNDNMVKQMLITNSKYLEYIINNIKQSIIIKIDTSFSSNILCFFGKLQRIGALINPYLFKVKSTCIKCNKCLSNCPTKAVYYKNNKYHFNHNCTMCMRCVSFCPTNSIKPGFLFKGCVNGKYDFSKILNDESLDGDYLSKCSKRFYKFYYKYYDNINNLLNKKA